MPERQNADLGLDASSDLERQREANRVAEGKPAPASQDTTDAERDARGADVDSVDNLEARTAGATTTDDPPADPEA
jgi:hypothetical protein